MRGLFSGLLSGVATLTALHVHASRGAHVADKTPQYQLLPSLREQAEIVDAWTEERKNLIPGLLRKYGVDAWLMSQREYAEDTVFWALKPHTAFSARRRTTQLFLAEPRPPGSPASYSWIENTDTVWRELRAVLETQNPARIAINAHRELAFASSLHAGERDVIGAALGDEWTRRFVVEPMLPIEVVAHMVPGRLQWYRRMMETAWAIIEEAFSEKVITPGVTRSSDVEWWMREKVQALNYTTWFQPSVFIVNNDDFPALTVDDPHAPDRPINYGDLIHTDFGVSALGLNTDTQHLGYVLRPGETEDDVPQSMLDGLAKVNRLQDIVKESMKIGLTGDDILDASRKQMSAEGIEGKIYCHATGEWGHSAGTVIGMTNLQDGVPVLGELPLLKNTYYSIELYAEHFVPEKNKTLKFLQEEDVYWEEKTETWEWVYGRQEKLLIVRTPGKTPDAPSEL